MIIYRSVKKCRRISEPAFQVMVEATTKIKKPETETGVRPAILQFFSCWQELKN